MLKYKNTKIWLIFILFFLGFINVNAIDVNATSLNTIDMNVTKVGDKVYIIFGKGSSARVESGNILKVGTTNSKIHWDDCSDCQQWVANSNFYYSLNKINKIIEQMDLEDMSMSGCGKKTILDRGVWDLINSITK